MSAWTGWTKEREELCGKLWVEGKSCTEVARAIGHGCTRNMVIGKVRRLVLPPRDPRQARSYPQYEPKAKRQKAAPHAVNFIRQHPKPKRRGIINPQRVAYAEKLAEQSRRLPLLSLKFRGECKWATHEENGEHLFCGHATDTGGSWCAAHARLIRAAAPGEPANIQRTSPIISQGAAGCDLSDAANRTKVAA